MRSCTKNPERLDIVETGRVSARPTSRCHESWWRWWVEGSAAPTSASWKPRGAVDVQVTVGASDIPARGWSKPRQDPRASQVLASVVHER